MTFSLQTQSWSSAACAVTTRVVKLGRGSSRGIETDPRLLATGENSGYQAINLAVHLGARRIVLLGYDLQVAKNGRTHFFGEHPAGLRSTPDYAAFAERFVSMVGPLQRLGVTVINASRRTALTCFPRQPIHEALPDASGAVA